MQFIKESIIKATPEKVFAFHELPDAFERLMPPWENANVIQKVALQHHTVCTGSLKRFSHSSRNLLKHLATAALSCHIDFSALNRGYQHLFINSSSR